MPGVLMPGQKSDTMGQMKGAMDFAKSAKDVFGKFGGGTEDAPADQAAATPEQPQPQPETLNRPNLTEQGRAEALNRRIKMSGYGSGGY